MVGGGISTRADDDDDDDDTEAESGRTGEPIPSWKEVRERSPSSCRLSLLEDVPTEDEEVDSGTAVALVERETVHEDNEGGGGRGGGINGGGTRQGYPAAGVVLVVMVEDSHAVVVVLLDTVATEEGEGVVEREPAAA